jgi:tetratricopeptide (TPR) repeat protein
MFYQRFVLICGLILMLAGCAGLYEKQPPAPVYGGHQGRIIQSAPSPSPQMRPRSPIQTPPQSVVKTKPLQDFNQKLAPIEIAPPAQEDNSMDAMSEDPGLEQVSSELNSVQSDINSPAIQDQEKLVTAPEQMMVPKTEIPLEQEIVPLTPFEPIEPPASLSPAIGALVVAANQNTQIGNVEVAAASIDRALKIEPRNPSLYYKLALLRLKQAKPQEAEDLAKKSALLAGKDKQLKKHSWLLIAHARELRRDYKGAKQARSKAGSF